MLTQSTQPPLGPNWPERAAVFIQSLNAAELALVCAYTARPRTFDFADGPLVLPTHYRQMLNRLSNNLGQTGDRAMVALRDHLRAAYTAVPLDESHTCNSQTGILTPLGSLTVSLCAAYAASLLPATKLPVTQPPLATLTDELDVLTELVAAYRVDPVDPDLAAALAITWTGATPADLISIASALQAV